MRFGEDYYKNIWGDVHRHDYTESLANRLIQQYGKVRILDAGCGCGHLVKLLREKGADAWGLEISDYAIENTCAKGYVLKGSVCEIPFKDKSFDVVHSSGLWEYLTEDQIDKAVKEVWRVGERQEHNIDHSGTIWQPEYQYVTWKPMEWWNKKLQRPNKVLVAMPTYEGKEYCFQEWINTVRNLTYKNYDILVVDNSKTEDFFNRWKDKIPMIHKTFQEGEKDDAMYRVCKSMAEIQKHFLIGGYTHWMNIEADVIPPIDVIEKLMEYGKDADWVAHVYPQGSNVGWMAGIGCSLLSRKLMTDFNWDDTTIADDSPDAELWSWVQSHGGYKTVELYYIFDVKHLK